MEKERLGLLLPARTKTIFVDYYNVISQQVRQMVDITLFHGFIQGVPYRSNLRAIQTGI
jgi:hypothetical protein